MRDTDTLWREVVCAECSTPVMRFYRRDGRLMLDYRTTYTAADHEARTVAPSHHSEWFNGMDYLDETEDSSSVLLDIECYCCSTSVDLAAMRQVASDAPKRRAAWHRG